MVGRTLQQGLGNGGEEPVRQISKLSMVCGSSLILGISLTTDSYRLHNGSSGGMTVAHPE
jgi:uncharacterized membrane protein (UPF0136 family)